MATTNINNNSSAAKGQVIERESAAEQPLCKRNYLWMVISGVLIVIGFLLMLGGSSTEESFNPDIFSVRRTVVGPTISFAGYVLMAVAILLKPRKAEEAMEEPEA